MKTYAKDIILDDDDATPEITDLEEEYEFAGWNTKEDGTRNRI